MTTDPTNEIAVHEASSLTARMQYAQALAASSLLPAAYRKQPANVLVAAEYGVSLGLSAVTAMQMVHVIEGKPTASAQLIGALVRRAGHRLRVTGDDTHAVAEIVRADDPEFVFRSEWTTARAQQANLTGKGTWKQYPAAMLKARAITEVARDACPEALAGVAYTPEELGEEQHAAWPEPTTLTVVREPEPEIRPTLGEVLDGLPDDGDVFEAELVEDSTDSGVGVGTPQDASATPAPVKPSDSQLRMIGALFRDCGWSDRADRLRATSKIIGRQVGSANELSRSEASDLITVLKSCAEDANPSEALTAAVAS